MFTDIKKSPVEADTHTHTVASAHALSTVLEMAEYAAAAGLKGLIITDHGPALPDGAHEWHFGSLSNLPDVICGVRVLHGAEANILDYEGTIDLIPRYQRELDWVIASFHEPCCAPGTVAQITNAYLKLAENPYVDVIGHSGSPDYAYDYERVLPVFKAKGKLVEINSHTFDARKRSVENCRKIALLCKELRIPVVVSSDAHTCFSVGDVAKALEMLNSINFPSELILNFQFADLAHYIEHKRNKN